MFTRFCATLAKACMMIAVAGLLRLKRGEGSFDLAITARAQWPLTDINQDRYTA